MSLVAAPAPLAHEKVQTHYYAIPFSNKDQLIKQIALYILAALVIATAIALTTTTGLGIVCVLVGAITTPLTALAALVLFYIAKTTPFFQVTPGQIVSGPFGGLYEKNFLTGLNHAKLKTVTQTELEHRSDHPFFPNIKDRYDRFIERLKEPAPKDPLIPKKIHLIWIGPKPVSKTTQDVFDSWKKFHPDWECKMWRNEEAQQLIDEMNKRFPKVKEAWDAAASWAEKADILRCCILCKFGGFYADTDLPCQGRIDELHHFSKFFCCIQEVTDPAHSKLLPTIVCNNAAIGSIPDHPITIQMLNSLQPCPKSGSAAEDILDRTGPGLLTKCVRDYSNNSQNDDDLLVLPPIYFYPMPMQRSPLFVTDYGYVSVEDSAPYLTPVTKGVHLWEGSWVRIGWADIKRSLSRFFRAIFC